MTTRNRQRFVYGQTAWMTGSILILLVADALTLEAFFIVSFFGFLALLELTAPVNITPRWRTRLRWIIVLGFLVFAYVVWMRVLRYVPL